MYKCFNDSVPDSLRSLFTVRNNRSLRNSGIDCHCLCLNVNLENNVSIIMVVFCEILYHNILEGLTISCILGSFLRNIYCQIKVVIHA